ncbi:Phosphate-import ATP-binding protein PhnC [Halomonas sp. THAF12]|nr:Phosphate-import ATP-binding protein PhnC [Halomonas sp. THAF12]
MAPTEHTNEPLLTLDGVDLGHGERVVLPRVHLHLARGERVALLGPSGAGKSTLLAALRERLGGAVAWCPQHHGLVPGLAVYHNVYMGRLAEHSALANLWNLVRPLRGPWGEVAALCERVGLDGLMRRPVGQLSGGQRQRTAIARALYQQREVFLGDEPVASVDPHQAHRLLGLIEQRHTTSVIALHQRELALTRFDRVWGLRDGRLVIDAPASTLSLDDLDALYPDADDTAASAEAPEPAAPSPASLPCSRGRA